MRWEKLGCVWSAPPLHPKLLTHAANPVPVHRHGDIWRIFFSGRDAENRSSVGYLDLDVERRIVLHAHPEPVFLHGAADSWYSHGVSIGDCQELDGRRYLWFMGWHNPPGAHWRGTLGRLLLCNDDAQLEPDGAVPLLDLDARDPVSLSYPCLRRDDAGRWLMWYGSTRTWDRGDGSMVHDLRLATSTDGTRFTRVGDAVPWVPGVAQAFSRPTVDRAAGLWRMWFSWRADTGDRYRIGLATSSDGHSWSLHLHESGIDVSTTGWDSEMIEYPAVFRHRGRLHMLYCGNGYGRTGFGLAVLHE